MKRDIGRILKPRRRRTFLYRGVLFYTDNLEAIDPMTKTSVCFSSGKWTHDQALNTVFNSLDLAVADRFGLRETLGFHTNNKNKEQTKAIMDLRKSIAQAAYRTRNKVSKR